MNKTSTKRNMQSETKNKELKEAIKFLSEKLGKSESNLLLNNLLCIALQDFEHIVRKADNNDRRAMTIFACNTFLDYILDRLGAVGLCSCATDDMTLHECNNLVNRINRGSSHDNSDSLNSNNA